MKKSQISAEFVIIISAALVVFLIIFAIIDKRNNEIYSARTRLHAKVTSDNLASAINTMMLTGEGAKKAISLPESLKDGTSYSMNVYPEFRFVEIIWSSLGQQRQYTSPLITANISGLTTSLANTTLTISNSNGGIIIG